MIQDIEIEMNLPSRANLEKHWRDRAKLVEHQRQRTWLGARYQLVTTTEPINIKLSRVSARLLDAEDKLPMCFKAVKDLLCEWLEYADDRDERARWYYSQQKPLKGSRRGWQAARIIITPGHDNCGCCGAPLVAGQYAGPYYAAPTEDS